MKKILVTGADGFIGSHLTEALIHKGYDVRAFVMYNSFNSWGWLDTLDKETLKNIDIFSGDIRDPFGVETALKGCDAVFHLAALIGIPYSYHSPASYIDTNVKGTLNVVQASKKLGIKKVIHTSTSEVYGSAEFVPITEEHPLCGQSPYSASKIGSDQTAMSYYYSFKTPVTIVRPFNTFGPRQSARAVIPTVITQILNGKKEIKLGNVTPTRDFSFIEDTVAGFISVLNEPETIGETLNLGSSFEISILDCVNLIAEIMDTNIEIITDTQRVRSRESEVNRLYADITKIKKITGWSPEYGGVEGFKKGLIKTIEWFKNPDNLKLYKWDIYNV